MTEHNNNSTYAHVQAYHHQAVLGKLLKQEQLIPANPSSDGNRDAVPSLSTSSDSSPTSADVPEMAHTQTYVSHQGLVNPYTYAGDKSHESSAPTHIKGDGNLAMGQDGFGRSATPQDGADYNPSYLPHLGIGGNWGMGSHGYSGANDYSSGLGYATDVSVLNALNNVYSNVPAYNQGVMTASLLGGISGSRNSIPPQPFYESDTQRPYSPLKALSPMSYEFQDVHLYQADKDLDENSDEDDDEDDDDNLAGLPSPAAYINHGLARRASEGQTPAPGEVASSGRLTRKRAASMSVRKDPHTLEPQEKIARAAATEGLGKVDKRRVQNKLAQRAFRARSKVHHKSVATRLTQLDDLIESQSDRIVKLTALVTRLQKENTILKTEKWQQALATGGPAVPMLHSLELDAKPLGLGVEA